MGVFDKTSYAKLVVYSKPTAFVKESSFLSLSAHLAVDVDLTGRLRGEGITIDTHAILLLIKMSKQELNDELHTGFEYFIDQFEPLDRGRILAQFAAFGKEAEHFILMLKRPRHGKEELNRDWIEIVSPRVK